jgi:hypothetical protein
LFLLAIVDFILLKFSFNIFVYYFYPKK